MAGCAPPLNGGAAATTRFVFPVLVPRGAPGAGFRDRLARWMRTASEVLPKARWLVAGIGAAALVALAIVPSPWRGELSALSPVLPSELARDAMLRADVGAADGVVAGRA